MDNETLDFDALSKVEVNDITNLPGMSQEKLDLLESLGVMSNESYVEKNKSKESDNTEMIEQLDELEVKDEKEEPEVVIDINVDKPNIILPKVEIIRALRYASVMIKKVTSDIEASSLNITYKDGKVLYRLKDNMTWFELEGSCKVSNNNPITKTLTFNATYLTKLLSATANDVLIYEGTAVGKDGVEASVYYVRLAYGDYILDVFEGNEAKLVPAGNKKDLLNTSSAETISTLCDVMIPLINDTQEVQSKRTIIYDDRALFNSVTYQLQFRNKFAPMCLSKKELDLLKIVSAGSKDTEICFYSTDSEGENRIIITAPNITISTSVSIPIRDEMKIARLKTLENANYIKVNKEDFDRVLFLSGLGTITVSTLFMNYSSEGIDVKISGRTGDSSLLIPGVNNGIERLPEDITIYTTHLSVLLKSFDAGKDLEVAFLPEGVALRNATLGIEAIMNYAR